MTSFFKETKRKRKVSEKTIINKAWRINAAIFHKVIENDIHKGRVIQRLECHHGCGRVGIRKACRLLFVALTPVDHQNPKVLAYWRDELRILEVWVLNNFVHMFGCKEAYDYRCQSCPIYYANYGK